MNTALVDYSAEIPIDQHYQEFQASACFEALCESVEARAIVDSVSGVARQRICKDVSAEGRHLDLS